MAVSHDALCYGSRCPGLGQRGGSCWAVCPERRWGETMIAVIITVITSVLEIITQLWGSNFAGLQAEIEIFLAAVTPVLVWLLPQVPWLAKGKQG